MFPNAQAQDWFFTFLDWFAAEAFQASLSVDNQPCPSRTEASCAAAAAGILQMVSIAASVDGSM